MKKAILDKCRQGCWCAGDCPGQPPIPRYILIGHYTQLQCNLLFNSLSILIYKCNLDNSPPSDLPSEIYSVVPSPPWVNASGFVGHQFGGRILAILFPIPGSAMTVPFCSGYYLPLVAAPGHNQFRQDAFIQQPANAVFTLADVCCPAWAKTRVKQ
jgi:hypothetical protein